VGDGRLRAAVRLEPVERSGASGVGGSGGRRPSVRRGAPRLWARGGVARRSGVRTDTRGCADVPLQQPGFAAGARARRRRVLRAAGVRTGQQPVVVGVGRGGGGDRLSRQDDAGLPGAARFRRCLSGVRGRAVAYSVAAARGRRVCARRVRRLVPAAGRTVAYIVAPVHRRVAARQHRRVGVGLQRVRSADR
jgi:hypothetical protein